MNAIAETRADGTVHHVLNTGVAFSMAVAKYFGLPGDQVHGAVTVESGADSVFGVNLFIALTPEDLEAIGKHMAATGAELRN